MRLYNSPSSRVNKFSFARFLGSILLENWRPIRLEKVAMSPQKTVNDILGQISSYVTLKIQIPRLAAHRTLIQMSMCVVCVANALLCLLSAAVEEEEVRSTNSDGCDGSRRINRDKKRSSTKGCARAERRKAKRPFFFRATASLIRNPKYYPVLLPVVI